MDNTLSSNLERIKNATDSIRTITDTSSSEIEDVAQAVSDLNADNISKASTIDLLNQDIDQKASYIHDQELEIIRLSGKVDQLLDSNYQLNTRVSELEQEIEEVTPKGNINITENGVSDVASYATATILVEQEEKTVFFYDYDATLLYEYSASELLSMSTLPDVPSHDGLICQGWNYTLQEAKDYVNSAKDIVLEVGALYKTDDNTLRFYIELGNPSCLHPYLNTYVENGIIDWGDGTTTNVNGSFVEGHEYSTIGNYVIKVSGDDIRIEPQVFNQAITFLPTPDSSYGPAGSTYTYAVKKVELPDNIYLGAGAFRHFKRMETITFPRTLRTPSYFQFDSVGWFDGCECLKCTIFPGPNNAFENAGQIYYRCFSLTVVSIPNLTKFGKRWYAVFGSGCIGIKHIPSASTLRECYINSESSIKVSELILPNIETLCNVTLNGDKIYLPKVTSFRDVRLPLNIEEISIPSLVNIYDLSISNQGGASILKRINFPNVVRIDNLYVPEENTLEEMNIPSLTTFPQNFYSDLPYLEYIDFPHLTSLGSDSFRSSQYLKRVNLPNLTTIPDSCSIFGYIQLLTEIAFPKLQKIGANLCNPRENLSPLMKIDFSECEQIPVWSQDAIDNGAFNNLSEDAKILVPDELYEDWIVTPGWTREDILPHIIRASEYTEGGSE